MRKIVGRFAGLVVALAVVLVLVMVAAEVFAAASITVHPWYRVGGRSTGTVKLAKMADASGDPDNVTGTWSSADSAYKFSVDESLVATWDPTSRYQIYDNGSSVLQNIALPSVSVAIAAAAHYAAVSGVHGVAGSVVGTSDAQVLTNKTIDGDNNTVQDLPGSALKVDAVLPQHSVKPSGTFDTYLFTTSTADAITLQASDAAKGDDDSLVVIAEKIRLKNAAGLAIKVSGLAAATVNGDAVRYDEFAALGARVTALERNDVFSASPSVALTVWRAGGGLASHVNVSWVMSPVSDMDSVKRFEIYRSGQAISIAAGAADANDLAYLRENCTKTIMNPGEWGRRAITGFESPDAGWVCVVAVDWAGTAYNSAVASVGSINGGMRDGVDNITVTVTRPVWSYYGVAEGPADSSADTFSEWIQSTVTERTKTRGVYRKQAGDVTFKLAFFAKAGTGSGEDGFVRVRLINVATAAESASAVYVINYTGSYPSTAQELAVDVSSLTDGMLYGIEVSMFSESTWAVTMKQQMTAEVVQELTGQ